MKAQIIKIGNSKGIRIPKPLLEESNLEGDVDIEVVEEGLLIKSTNPPRYGWNAAFMALSESDSDELMIGETSSRFDEDNWRW